MAKRKQTRKKQYGYSSQVPAWVWLFTGSVLGAFIMFLVYLRGIPVSESKPLSTQTNKPGSEQVIAPETDDDGNLKPRFVFYELLKETEVKVNPPPLEQKAKQEALQNTRYILQAGSFRSAADADRMRAQLLLLNLEAKVSPSQVGETTWHRVMVGPYDTRAQAARARGILAGIDVDSITRKIQSDD